MTYNKQSLFQSHDLFMNRFLTTVLLLLLIFLGSRVANAEVEYQSVPVFVEAAADLPAFFEQCKQNEALLIAVLHQMPKGADLHNHASGAFTSETYIDEAIDKAYYFDRATQGFVIESPTANYFPARGMVTDFSLLGEALTALTMGNAAASTGESGHDHFFLAFRRFPKLSEEAKKKAFVNLFLHNASQRVYYMELMATPPVFSDKGVDPTRAATQANEFDDTDELSLLQQAQEIAKKELEKQIQPNALNVIRHDSAPVMPEVAYITTVSRDKYEDYDPNKPFDVQSYRNYFTKMVAKCFSEMKAGKYVGMTILSPEDSWIGRTQFSTQLQVINEVWEQHAEENFYANMNLHGGELTPEYSPLADMQDRISRTITLGHAKRIGHGVSIAWEKKLLNVLQEMKGKTAVEICLTSNLGILGVKGEQHPFMLYWKAGVPVVLCTDDEGISRSNLTLEYVRAAQWFDLSYGQIKWLSLTSLEHAFVSGESMFENGDPRLPKKDFPYGSAKARIQQRVYDAFTEFEMEMVEYMKLFPKPD